MKSVQSMLKVERLTKTYRTAAGGELTVLREVSFDILAGASAAIVGPSGSGKTTLLGLCAGLDRPSRFGSLGGLLSFFAVGCPICNKVVVIALGTSGALTWFAPVQPYLGVFALGLLAWALRVRLRGEVACTVDAR